MWLQKNYPALTSRPRKRHIQQLRPLIPVFLQKLLTAKHNDLVELQPFGSVHG